MEKVTISSITLDEDSKEVIVESLRIKDATFFNFVKIMEEDQREAFIKSALVIGAEMIQSSSTKVNVDYMRSEFDKVKTEVERVKIETTKQLDEVFGEE